MTTYFTADWHLFHDRAVCGPSKEAMEDGSHWHGARPFKSIDAMHRTLIDNYCEVVKDGDSVYFLGDLTMRGPNKCGPVMEIVKALPGRKHYVMGNHDRLAVHTYLKMGFMSVHSMAWIGWGSSDASQRDYGLIHDPDGVEAIKPHLGGMAYDGWFCGHVHDEWKIHPDGWAVVNVGVDVWDYAPVTLRALSAAMRKIRYDRRKKN